MAVMDMIMEAMCPTPDAKFLQKNARFQKMEDKSFRKAFNIGGNRKESTEIPKVSMKASDALEAMTAHMDAVNMLHLNETSPDLAQAAQEAMALGELLDGKKAPVDYGLEADMAAAEACLADL